VPLPLQEAAAPPGAPIVELRGVTKAYPEGASRRVVLSGVDLRLHPGEFVVLLGRSGSGKSTLLNLVSGIDVPSEGEVWLAGEPLSRLSERRRTLMRRERVGFVFQAFNLLPTLTVEENVRLPLELTGAAAAAAGARARGLLAQVGLADRAGAFPDKLSGGEQQRVAVARALAHAPRLILADEPTGNLDEETGRKVLDLLEGLARREQGAVLVVTHDPELRERADRVLRMDHGRLVEERGRRPAAPAGAGPGGGA
jgi:putative ABC transport system ATP-binding protein